MNIDDLIANGTITFENGRSDLNAEQEAAEISTITSALKVLWNNEAYRGNVFDKLDIVEGKVLRIGLLEGSATSFSNIAIVGSQYTPTYLDNTGAAHTGSFLRTLAHEVLHAVLDRDDTVDDLTGGQVNPDYLGETVIATNTYMETIDYSMARASYSATGDFLAAEENGQWLWNGDTADVVLVAKGETSQVGGTTRPSANVDTSHNTTGLKDLIIGWNGANNISTGAGDDYIYGRGGADTLNAGEGNDNVMAGTGNDIVIGGLGNDFSNGGADVDTLDYSALNLDITIALADPAGSDYDALFTATPDSGGWVDRFTDFETVTLSTQDTTLTINGANTLEALNAEAITVDGNTGSNSLDLSGVEQGIDLSLKRSSRGAGCHQNSRAITSKLKAITLSIMALTSAPTMSLADHGRPHFAHDYPYQGIRIIVEEVVNTHGVLLRDGVNFYSLWGVIPDFEYLKVFLEGNKLVCTVLGDYIEDDLTIAVLRACEFMNTTPIDEDIEIRQQVALDNIRALDGMDLQEFLLANGHGQPLCGDVRYRHYEACE